MSFKFLITSDILPFNIPASIKHYEVVELSAGSIYDEISTTGHVNLEIEQNTYTIFLEKNVLWKRADEHVETRKMIMLK